MDLLSKRVPYMQVAHQRLQTVLNSLQLNYQHPSLSQARAEALSYAILMLYRPNTFSSHSQVRPVWFRLFATSRSTNSTSWWVFVFYPSAPLLEDTLFRLRY